MKIEIVAGSAVALKPVSALICADCKGSAAWWISLFTSDGSITTRLPYCVDCAAVMVKEEMRHVEFIASLEEQEA